MDEGEMSISLFRNLGQLICRDRDLSKIALIDRGDRIAILSANCAEYLAAFFGIMRAGLVAVPVNFKFPAKVIDFIIRDAGVKLVFCDSERRSTCPSGLPIVCFGDVANEGFEQFLNPGPFAEIVPATNEPAMFL